MGFPRVFCVLLVSSKGCLFFWFWMLKNQKTSSLFWFLELVLEVGKLQEPKKPRFFGFSAFKTKKTNTLSTKPKETKKNSRDTKKPKLFPETKNSVSKNGFLFFGFWSLLPPETKKTKHPFDETKRNQKNSRETKKQNFSLKPRIMFQKIVFWFLVSWW